MAKYPLFLELDNRPAVVIGGGNIALQKAKTLLKAGARLKIVAKELCDCLETLCQENGIPTHIGAYTADTIEDAILVVAATDDRSVNEAVFRDCRERRILCNVVDVPDLCDFYVPAVISRGPLQIAIGTDGKSPAFAGQLRRQLESLITDQHGEFVSELQKMRKIVIEQIPADQRKTLLTKMASEDSFEIFAEKGHEAWQHYAQLLIDGVQE